MSSSRDDEFHPSAAARSTLQWASEHGAATLGESYDLLGPDAELAGLL